MNDITRRDFLNGVALTIAAGLACADTSAGEVAAAYPPALTGMRGSQPGSFEVAHALRDGTRYDFSPVPVSGRYDLVVVGAGISGLAAAWFYRQKKPHAKILLLENHDEFGGHARRNEFRHGDRLLIGYGGSEALQSPTLIYGDVAKGLLRSLGVDVKRFETAFDRTLYPGLGLSRGILFKRETFGIDKLVTGDPMRMMADDIPADRMNARTVAAFIADFPISAAARAQLIAVFTDDRDPLPGKSPAEKAALLDTISYRTFLRQYWGLDDEALSTLQGRSLDFFAIGIDGIPAAWAKSTGYPGFAGIGLEESAEERAEFEDPYIYHFPDGNASLARLLVRALIPGVATGHTMDDIVTAQFDYSQLDRPAAATRLRLNSTVVQVRNLRDAADIGYVQDGKLVRVQASACVLAGYHMMIPYLMPELPTAQRAALASNVKAPLVYVTVLVRNWHPWVKLGVHEVTNPMGFFSRLKLDYPVSLGSYRCPRSPDEPMLLHLVHVPTAANQGLDQRSAQRLARASLYSLTFAQIETQVRDELTRILGPGSFDAQRDIEAITVNRWSHGYSYSSNSLYDAPSPEGAERPYVVARARAGRVAIANSDSAWSAYAHAAIRQAHRAVTELLSTA